jgi:hypothetical protein
MTREFFSTLLDMEGGGPQNDTHDGSGTQCRINGLQSVFRNGVADEIGYGIHWGADAARNTRQKAVLCDQHEAEHS